MNETVSINITTCNRAHLLPRCVKSVLKQTYPNIEINIIDDASEDSTVEVLRTLQSGDPRIRIFQNEHRKGNAASRNLLLKECTGTYIAFLDDDDYWTDFQKLEKQVRNLDKYHSLNQAAISCTDVVKETTQASAVTHTRMPDNLIKAILCGNGFIFNSTVMTTLQTLTLTNGFDEGMKRGVDSEFFRTAIVDHQASVDFIPETTTVCTVHGQRMTTSRTFKDRCDVAKAHFRIIRKHRKAFIAHPSAFAYRLIKLITAILKP